MKVQQIIKDGYTFSSMCHFCDTFWHFRLIYHWLAISCSRRKTCHVTKNLAFQTTWNHLKSFWMSKIVTDKSQKAPSLRRIWLEMERPKYNIFDRKFYKKTWSEKIKVSHSISYQTLETISANSNDWNYSKLIFYGVTKWCWLDGALSQSN